MYVIRRIELLREIYDPWRVSVQESESVPIALNTVPPEPVYPFISRLVGDAAFQAYVKADPKRAVEEAGIKTDQGIADIAKVLELLLFIDGIQSERAKKIQAGEDGTRSVALTISKTLENTLMQIQDAFRWTMIMYSVSFYLSVGLVLAAVAIAFMSREPILPSIFGTLGTANILLFLLTRPQESLQSSRASLAQLQAALYTWFMNTTNLFSSVELTAQGQPEKIQIRSVAECVMTQTAKTLEMLQKYCKLTQMPPKTAGVNLFGSSAKGKKTKHTGSQEPGHSSGETGGEAVPLP